MLILKTLFEYENYLLICGFRMAGRFADSEWQVDLRIQKWQVDSQMFLNSYIVIGHRGSDR
jgi:hypothetical protein